MTFIYAAALYIVLSMMAAVILRKLHKSGKCLPSVPPALFTVLSFTWGLPVTVIGSIAAAFMLIKGKKPERHKLVWCFSGNQNFGISLGIFIFVPENSPDSMKDHELGHSVQNALLGIFAVSAVFVPSAIRYQIREIRHGKCRTGYDDVWFEGQASRTGRHIKARKVDKDGKTGYNGSR